MPWSEMSPMDQRLRFIADAEKRLFTVTELCRRYGVSRKTGYKWLARYEEEGPFGLYERSRRPQRCPHRTPEGIVEAILETRRRHPRWGAKKLLKLVQKKHPRWTLPARSTVCDILMRYGMIAKRRRPRRPGHPGRPTTTMCAPNMVWTADFKGHFKTRDGRYCYPLTIADGFSRYLLACKGLRNPDLPATRPVFARVFREYGLPRIIRTDNGAPFATTAIARLSRLSVWWIRLGIYPELIEPGHPEQNPRHERMHRDLKSETTRPPAATLRTQQRRFNDFRNEYNHVRPHEALNQETPASFYDPSQRAFPERLPPVEYPDHFEVRRVSTNGGIRWNSAWVNVSHVLGGEYVALEEIDSGLWTVYFGPLELGRFHERELVIEDSLGRKERRKPKVLPMSPD
jgi:putative transposase